MALTYEYRYRLPAPGGHTTCRVRIYREGEQTIGLVTWRQADYAALSAGARTVALVAALAGWHHPLPDRRLLIVEHLLYPRGDGPDGARETFAAVEFAGSTAHGGAPHLRPLARGTVEGLLGETLAD